MRLIGGHQRIGRVRAAVDVEGVERLQPRRLEAVAFGVVPQRGVAVDVEVQVERGVEHHLVGDAVEPVVVGHRRDGSDHAAAGTVAGDRERLAVPLQVAPLPTAQRTTP